VKHLTDKDLEIAAEELGMSLEEVKSWYSMALVTLVLDDPVKFYPSSFSSEEMEVPRC
jgi:hypothetical protein